MKIGDAVVKSGVPFWMTIVAIRGCFYDCRFGTKGCFAGTFYEYELKPYEVAR